MNPLLPASVQQNIVLASRSPRRVDILRGLDIEFETVPASDDAEARATKRDPFELPVECARLKAGEVSAKHPGAVVIGADTVVILGNHLLEKPRDDNEAVRFLEMLSGAVHTVVTGVAVIQASRSIELCDKEETRVRFRDLSRDEIERYVASGEGRDKAGSYAVQGLGAGLVRSIDGCFYNVVGLPVSLLFDMLKKVS
jgi:septum formation protein